MSQRMLIDARHPEETRVAVINGTRIEEFDFEAAERKQLKGNIYLAKVTRVEPSLQAAFIDYGGNRHGFLAFAEIHPDYYQIPREDREALLREEAELAAEEHHDDHHEVGEDGAEDPDAVAVTGGADDAGSDVLRRQRQALRRKYKIQEVIRRRQVILVQVVKEERGNKGAALTTYLSLAGRFCVLMPNTAHGGGISRKISNLSDRKRLKQVMADLQLPAGMGAIVRTAGLKRTRTEIKRDFDYLTRLWDEIRDTTLSSVAPCLVHQDSDLIKRAIRDIYSREIEQVLVDGEAGFKAASSFMEMLMPSHVAKVVQYTDAVPLFQRFGVEASLAGMYQPVVQLKSGGYIVINPTEALVSIDVNSGRSTREHGIEETAYKTNLEAADEIGRQLRLRDMAGLVVIDFIDMEVGGNNRRVERAMKEAMKNDRARIAIGRISSFGLMEMSRQRLRTGVLEASTHVCPMCDGSGYVRSVGSAALAALRALEAEAIKGKNDAFQLRAGLEVAMYILNRKRADVVELEERYGVDIETIPDETLMGPNFVLDAAGPPPANPVVMTPLPAPVTIIDDDEVATAEDRDDYDDDDAEQGDGERESGRGERGDNGRGDNGRGDSGRGGSSERGRGRRRRGRRDENPGTNSDSEAVGETSADGSAEGGDAEGQVDDRGDAPAEARSGERDGADGSRRRRRRRGGGGRDRDSAAEPVADSVVGGDAADAAAGDGVAALMTTDASGDVDALGSDGKPRRRRRGGRGRRREGGPATADDAGTNVEALGVEAPAGSTDMANASVTPPAPAAVAADDEPAAPVKKPRKSRAKAAPVEAEAPVAAVVEATASVDAEAPAKPRRTRRKASEAAPDPVVAPTAAVVPAPEAAVAPVAAAKPVAAAAPEETAPATATPTETPAPRKGGWWQRTFGN
jgi:ribonuclease E